MAKNTELNWDILARTFEHIGTRKCVDIELDSIELMIHRSTTKFYNIIGFNITTGVSAAPYVAICVYGPSEQNKWVKIIVNTYVVRHERDEFVARTKKTRTAHDYDHSSAVFTDFPAKLFSRLISLFGEINRNDIYDAHAHRIANEFLRSFDLSRNDMISLNTSYKMALETK